MSDDRWRECDDPEVLAAAVAAGVEVQVFAYAELAELAAYANGWYPAGYTTAEQFAYAISNGARYRVPARWQPTPEPPDGDEPCATNPCEPPADDLRERIARVIDDWHNTVEMWTELDDLADAVLAVLPPQPAPAPDGCEAVFLPTGVVDEFANDTADTITLRDVRVLAACRDACRAAVARRPSQKPPTPPWPGAVLSGLVDEDGQPTWLAQVISVRGEWIRCAHALGWTKTHGYRPTEWVEVRAPRPAAATERVQAWEAVKDGRQVVGASSPFEAHYIWRGGPERAFIGERTMDKAVLVAPDGTVEVLREGGDQ